jgi:DnaK suppressor protein
MTDPIDADLFRTILTEKRASLGQHSETARDAARTVELDQTRTGRLSRMDALQGQAMARATEQRRQLELRRIEAALARLDSGEFGECMECGNMIPPGRLKMDPAATLCLTCAERAEASAGVRR